MPSYPPRRGFTLVELLVVMAIIALLIAMLLPSLSAARKAAQLVQCSSNMRQFLTAITMYCEANGTYPNGRYNQASLIGYKTHNTLRDEFGIKKSLIVCPSSDQQWARMTPRNWSNKNRGGWSAVAMTYWYTAGPSDRPLPNHPDNNNAQNTNGWRNATFPRMAQGYFPPLHNNESRLQHSRWPIFFDLMYPKPGTGNPNLPQQSNHPGSDNFTARGGNVGYVDGHVNFQPMVRGESWLYGTPTYNGTGIYLNTPEGPPAGASLLP